MLRQPFHQESVVWIFFHFTPRDGSSDCVVHDQGQNEKFPTTGSWWEGRLNINCHGE
jgi:hypothetical protein